MEWISIKEKLPLNGDSYLLVTNGRDVWLGDFDPRPHVRQNEKWGVVYNGAPPFDSTEITHWMPLPPLPTKEDFIEHL